MSDAPNQQARPALSRTARRVCATLLAIPLAAAGVLGAAAVPSQAAAPGQAGKADHVGRAGASLTCRGKASIPLPRSDTGPRPSSTRRCAPSGTFRPMCRTGPRGSRPSPA